MCILHQLMRGVEVVHPYKLLNSPPPPPLAGILPSVGVNMTDDYISHICDIIL